MSNQISNFLDIKIDANSTNVGIFAPQYFLKTLKVLDTDSFTLNFLYEHSQKLLPSAISLCAQNSNIGYYYIEEEVRLAMFEFHKLLHKQIPLINTRTLPGHIVSSAWKTSTVNLETVINLINQSFNIEEKLLSLDKQKC